MQLKPYPFQTELIHKSIDFLSNGRENSCYNACEQGLGKTVMAIETAKRLANGKDFKVLIVCPAVMRLTWEREIRQWYPQAEAVVHQYSGRRYQYPRLGFVIVSYAIVHTSLFLTHIRGWNPDMLILDEAHFVKNSKAIRSKTVFQELWPKATYRLALSGTPFTQGIVDGYTLFHRMAPREFPDWNSFTSRYSYSRVKQIPGRFPIVEYYGIKNVDELRTKIRSNFYLRKTKSEVLPELPDKTFQTIYLPEEYSIRNFGKKEMDEAKVQAHMVHKALANDSKFTIPATLAEHRRLQGEAKVPAIAEFILNMLEAKIPLVVFAYHLSVIERLRTLIDDADHVVLPITGATSAAKRQTIIDKFQTGEFPIFLGQINAAGVGITLTRASYVILAELDWSPAVVAQAIDRVHRIGQKNAVTVYDFRVKGSIDDAIVGTLMSKVRDFKAVLEN